MTTCTVTVDIPEVSRYVVEYHVKCGETHTTVVKTDIHDDEDQRWLHGLIVFPSLPAAIRDAEKYVMQKETLRLIREQVYEG